MKNEFRRFNLEKAGFLAVVLQLLGASGLIVGWRFTTVLILSSGGLATLMLLGLAVRVRLKDGLIVSMPALVLFAVNGYICLKALALP